MVREKQSILPWHVHVCVQIITFVLNRPICDADISRVGLLVYHDI